MGVMRLVPRSLLVLGTLIAATAFAVPSADASGELIINCPVVKVAQVDPLLAWNQQQSAHEHMFFCNKAVAFDATVAQMQAGESAGQVKSDKASMWTPTMKSPLGQTVLPTKMSYSIRNDPGRGDAALAPSYFGYVAGNSSGTQGGATLWRCIGAPTTVQTQNIPSNCDAYGNKGVTGAQYFTNANPCWDGVNGGPGFGTGGGPADGKDHVNDAVNGTCPAPNKRVVGNGWGLNFPPAAIGGRLSSDGPLANPGASMHWDHVTFDNVFLKKVADDCLNYVDSAKLAITCVVRADGGVYRMSDNKLVTF